MISVLTKGGQRTSKSSVGRKTLNGRGVVCGAGHAEERLRSRVMELEAENRELKEFVSAFRQADTSKEARERLFSHFEHELSILTRRLETRKESIDMVSRDTFGFRTVSDATDPAKDLRAECKELVKRSLHLERVHLVGKMRLRLFHDQRDLSNLRKCLNGLRGGRWSVDDDQRAINREKIRINRVRRMIGHERLRIQEYMREDFIEHEAARIIQKNWRGYIYRLNVIDNSKGTSPHPEEDS